MTIDLAGERVTLDADRALVWRDVLVVADPHFGKDASARARAIPLPSGTTPDDLARLDALIQRHATREVWLLGDVFDSAHAREPATIAPLVAWRARHHGLPMRMVAGNHDRRALPLAERVGFEVLPNLASRGPWRLAHHPVTAPDGHVLCGHVHPGVSLRGWARERLRCPAFIVGPERTILPAFGSLTGLATVNLDHHEAGYALAAGRVVGPVRGGAR